jgi:hypothetical protein
LDRATYVDETLNWRIRARVDRPYLLVMEYVPGISISYLGFKRAVKTFDHIAPKSRDRMIRLGMILGFDTFINNSDRMQMNLWDNSGNPENLLLKIETNNLMKTEELRDPENLVSDIERFYAIDHRASTPFKSNKIALQNIMKYLDRLEGFLNKLFMDLRQVMLAKIDPMFDASGKLDAISEFNEQIFKLTQFELKGRRFFVI